MSTTATPPAAAAPVPAKSLSSRPPTNLHPTAQPGPKAPPSSIPPTVASPKAATESPDMSKASVSPVNPAQAIQALFAEKSDAKPITEPAKAEVKPDATATVPDKKPETAPQGDSFADMAPPDNLTENAKKGWETVWIKYKEGTDAVAGSDVPVGYET